MEKGYKFLILFLIIILILVGAFYYLKKSVKDVNDGYVLVNGKKFFVEVVDNDTERRQGLMFRYSLCPECGRLFIFEEEGYKTFWMKNTFIDLDILFINSDFEVVDFVSLNSCTKEKTCETYQSKAPAKYVLEVKANSFSNSILGETISFHLSN